MPPKQNPGDGSGNRPSRNNRDQRIDGLDLVGSDPAVKESGIRAEHIQNINNGGSREVDEVGNKANPGGMATGKREMVDGNGDVHVVVVERARAAYKKLDETDEGEIEEEAQNERREEGTERSGGVWDLGQEEGKGDGEEQSEISGELEKEKNGARKEGFRDVVEVL